MNTVHALVAIRHDRLWQAAHFQSTPAAFHGRPELVAALTEELRAVLRQGVTLA